MDKFPGRLEQIDFSKRSKKRNKIRTKLLTLSFTQLPIYIQRERRNMQIKTYFRVAAFVTILLVLAFGLSWAFSSLIPENREPADQPPTLSVDAIVTATFQALTQQAENTLASEPAPTKTATKSLSDEWRTYTNSEYNFSISYPANFEINNLDENNSSFYIGKKIRVSITDFNPLDCRGGCPVVESTEPATIAGFDATKVTGYLGSIGGNNPQQYLSYVILHNNHYYTFTLYTLSFDTPLINPPPATIESLNESDITLFAQILETFQVLPTGIFTPNANSTPSIQCKGDLTGIILTMPNSSWNCSIEISQDGAEGIYVSSPVFEIRTLYGLGRGLWCEPNQNENCVESLFYENEIVKLSLYKWYGESKEIFGTIPLTDSQIPISLSIKFTNMETRALTQTEMDELVYFIDSIAFNHK